MGWRHLGWQRTAAWQGSLAVSAAVTEETGEERAVAVCAETEQLAPREQDLELLLLA